MRGCPKGRNAANLAEGDMEYSNNCKKYQRPIEDYQIDYQDDLVSEYPCRWFISSQE